MSQAAEQLNALVQRYRIADDSNDIEGRVRASEALASFVAQLKRTATARAWTAYDQRRKECAQPASLEQIEALRASTARLADEAITGREIRKPDRRADRSPTLGRRVSDKVAARLKERA